MSELSARIAKAQHIGDRPRQEDAVAFHVAEDGEPTLAVLSDGMGGHADGDLASRIITGEVFGELYLAAARPKAFARSSGIIFDAALNAANQRLKESIEESLISKETGGTLICTSVHNGELRWLSVGDSMLYLFRDGQLRLLNDIHSLGAQLDRMAAADELPAEDAKDHPDRNCLTSAVTGGPIPKVDCPEQALALEAGDVILLASDGIEALKQRRLEKLIAQLREAGADLAAGVIEAIKTTGAEDQDNTSVIAIEISGPEESPAPEVAPHASPLASYWPRWGRDRGARA
ncbi:MAG: protein phosphatase 2C domain-containing protein [Pseudomonadota bacterium]